LGIRPSKRSVVEVGSPALYGGEEVTLAKNKQSKARLLHVKTT